MRLLAEHGEALEADLRREYRVQLRDLWRDDADLDWRELRVLVLGLPPHGTAVARSIHGASAGDWDDTREMLRQLLNVSADHAWAFLESNRDEKKQRNPVPMPQHWPSPYEPSPAAEDDEPVDERPVADAATTFAVLQHFM